MGGKRRHVPEPTLGGGSSGGTPAAGFSGNGNGNKFSARRPPHRDAAGPAAGGAVDMVLVMTVNPGFGGQRYIAAMEKKITWMRSLIEVSGRQIELEVDGGISAATIGGASAAGADVFVAGSALFNDERGLAAAVSDLRNRAFAGRAGRC